MVNISPTILNSFEIVPLNVDIVFIVPDIVLLANNWEVVITLLFIIPVSITDPTCSIVAILFNIILVFI